MENRVQTERIGRRRWVVLFFALALLAAGGVMGCAGGAQKRLLSEQDWAAMPDQQLLEYYFALGEEIDRCDRSAPTGSVGVGTGFGTGGVGFGIGISQGVRGCNTVGLRERRSLVRRELAQRGLVP